MERKFSQSELLEIMETLYRQDKIKKDEYNKTVGAIKILTANKHITWKDFVDNIKIVYGELQPIPWAKSAKELAEKYRTKIFFEHSWDTLYFYDVRIWKALCSIKVGEFTEPFKESIRAREYLRKVANGMIDSKPIDQQRADDILSGAARF